MLKVTFILDSWQFFTWFIRNPPFWIHKLEILCNEAWLSFFLSHYNVLLSQEINLKLVFCQSVRLEDDETKLFWLISVLCILSLVSADRLCKYLGKLFQHKNHIKRILQRFWLFWTIQYLCLLSSLILVLISIYTLDSSSIFVNVLELFPSYILRGTLLNQWNDKVLHAEIFLANYSWVHW